MEQRLQQAIEFTKNGQREQAQNVVRDVLKNNPKNADAWYVAALIIENKEQQISALTRVLDLEPNHPLANNALDRLMADGDYDIVSMGITSVVPKPLPPVAMHLPAGADAVIKRFGKIVALATGIVLAVFIVLAGIGGERYQPVLVVLGLVAVFVGLYKIFYGDIQSWWANKKRREKEAEVRASNERIEQRNEATARIRERQEITKEILEEQRKRARLGHEDNLPTRLDRDGGRRTYKVVFKDDRFQ